MDLPRLRVAPESPATDSPATERLWGQSARHGAGALHDPMQWRAGRRPAAPQIQCRTAPGQVAESWPPPPGGGGGGHDWANHGPCSVPPQQPRCSLLKRAAAAAPYTASAPPTRAAAPPGRGRQVGRERRHETRARP